MQVEKQISRLRRKGMIATKDAIALEYKFKIASEALDSALKKKEDIINRNRYEGKPRDGIVDLVDTIKKSRKEIDEIKNFIRDAIRLGTTN